MNEGWRGWRWVRPDRDRDEFLSCMHERKLVSISLRPTGGFNFPTPDPTVQALSPRLVITFIRQTLEILRTSDWKTDIPNCSGYGESCLRSRECLRHRRRDRSMNDAGTW